MLGHKSLKMDPTTKGEWRKTKEKIRSLHPGRKFNDSDNGHGVHKGPKFYFKLDNNKFYEGHNYVNKGVL